MNFRKAGIFQRDTEKPEVQNDSGGMLAVWGSPGSGKTVTAVKIAKALSAKKKNCFFCSFHLFFYLPGFV